MESLVKWLDSYRVQHDKLETMWKIFVFRLNAGDNNIATPILPVLESKEGYHNIKLWVTCGVLTLFFFSCTLYVLVR